MHKISLDTIRLMYGTYPGLLFTETGIIVAIKTFNPFLLWPTMPFDITEAYLTDTHIVAKGILACDTDALQNLGFQVLPIRTVLGQTTAAIQKSVVAALHGLHFESFSQYCGSCGNLLIYSTQASKGKECVQCQAMFFPKYAPAVMVLVWRGTEMLLARSPHFKPGVYSALAGFIDAGETAEEALHREVKEEVGLEVGNLSYFGTQSWPFPDSFMIAFTAEYLSGELVVDKNELEAAQWFNFKALPELPSMASISRRLIENFLKTVRT